PSPGRAAMCVGKCSRIVGPCLLVLGTVSMAANILLLFPGGASKYLLEGHISKNAKAMPGIWGGGIAVSTGVAPRPSSRVCRGGRKGQTNSSPLTPSALPFPQLALMGAVACFVLSGVGLTDGPLCLYNASQHGGGHGTLWGYPFRD
ncbi:T4S1 protein, partial [Atlantisia rogersi]|nr:T4S1 protein [Atlantisia rogersi]